MGSLFIFAAITPKSEYFSEAEKAILGIIEQTRSESGCREFKLLKGEEGQTLYLSEEWTDQVALDAHYAQDYTKAVFKSYGHWLSKPVSVTKMHKIA